VNPWMTAQPGSEALERDLFARRARAMEPAQVPPLAAVLRAVETNRETRAARGAQGRTFMAMALAAACLMAAFTRLPSTEATGAIVADLDASAPRQGTAVLTASAATCTLDDETSDPLMSIERACVAPAPLFTAAPPSFTAAPPQSSMPESLTCAAAESCAIATP
jgi:hypothetical protein